MLRTSGSRYTAEKKVHTHAHSHQAHGLALSFRHKSCLSPPRTQHWLQRLLSLYFALLCTNLLSRPFLWCNVLPCIDSGFPERTGDPHWCYINTFIYRVHLTHYYSPLFVFHIWTPLIILHTSMINYDILFYVLKILLFVVWLLPWMSWRFLFHLWMYIALIERAQFAHNHSIYIPGALDFNNMTGKRSFLEYYLWETEKMHGKNPSLSSPELCNLNSFI